MRIGRRWRDGTSYWNCLAQEYPRDGNKSMSEQDFTSLIASVCPSERQNFRVMLVDYLAMQFPDADAGAHMTTANNAIALAQKDIVTAFIKHRRRRNAASGEIAACESRRFAKPLQRR